jgi:hypothetical protein
LLTPIFAASAGAQTVVSSNVTVNTVWSGEIILEQPIFVNNGATLTIDAGTIIRGQPRTAAVQAGVVAGSPGALIITQNGTIDANGTAADPIIFTTAAIDNDNDDIPDSTINPPFLDPWTAGDTFYDDDPVGAPLSPLDAAGEANVSLWGGLVILGEAPTNLANGCGTGVGTCTVEGLTVPGFPVADALYGGNTVGDSSGEVEYISVRHAGDEIGNGNELNGITLAGVGNGTLFSYIEVYCNFDDGIEWFGGTIDGDHLSVTFAGDDQFDVDQGYTGANQFLVAMLPYFNEADSDNFGSSSGDKGCECDGDDAPGNVNLPGGPGTQPVPLSDGEFYNFTIAGSDQSTTYNGHVNDNDGWEVRNGFAGFLANGIIYNTGVRQCIDVAGGGATNFTAADNAAAGLLTAQAVTCDDGSAIPAAPSPEDDMLNVNGVDNLGFAGVNQAGFRLYAEDTSFDPTGVAGKLDASLGYIDLRPATADASMTGGLNPAVPPAVDNGATYRGAFPTGGGEMWTAGWTALSLGGIVPVPEPGMGSLLVAGVMGLAALSRRRA